MPQPYKGTQSLVSIGSAWLPRRLNFPLITQKPLFKSSPHNHGSGEGSAEIAAANLVSSTQTSPRIGVARGHRDGHRGFGPRHPVGASTDAASQYQPRVAIALSERCREPAGGAKGAAAGIGHFGHRKGLGCGRSLLLPNSRHSVQGGRR
jgi:hypothetical protein